MPEFRRADSASRHGYHPLVIEKNTDGWIQAKADEWLRKVDGVRVRRADAGWDVLTGSGRVAASAKDAETGRRLADVGAFDREGVPPVYEFPDAAGLPALVDCIRHLYGLDATWLESVPVHEKHEGQTVWEGEVQVFAVEHPKADRVYAWSHETDSGKRRFHAVLGAVPVDAARAAVRVAIVGEDTGFR